MNWSLELQLFYGFAVAASLLGFYILWLIQTRVKCKVEYHKRQVHECTIAYYESVLGRVSIKEQQVMIQEMIDKGSDKIEKLHKDTSGLAFTLLDAFVKDKKNTSKIKETHDKISKGVFNVLRNSNSKIGDITDSLLKLDKTKKEEQEKDES
ncbi:MAG: hypothetical protein AAF518_11610 [Spirochaetota bacterium]